MSRFPPCLLLSVLLASLAAEEIRFRYGTADHKGYRNSEMSAMAQEILYREDAEALAAYLLALTDAEQADLAMLTTANVLTIQKRWDAIDGVCRSLLATPDNARAPLVAAELLFLSVDVMKAMRVRGTQDIDAYPDHLSELAVGLLEHENPVVQGIAEWAIGLRVGKHNLTESKLRRLLPSETSGAWYVPWLARSAEHRLADDYARQLLFLRRHRSVQGLAEDIDKQEQRMRAMLAADNNASALSQLSAWEDALTAAREAITDGDILQAQRSYIDLRLAQRELIMASRSEFPREGIVFHTLHGVPGGHWNINVGARPGPNKPGGELYRKPAADPAVAPEALIEGRLGAGSIRGIDLIWETDRVLFSFWSQPLGDGFRGNRGYSYQEPARIHEIVLGSGELRTITDSDRFGDIEPCYLPSGDYMFASNRSGFGNQCSGSFFQDKICTTLYRLQAGESQPIAISNNKDFDRYPRVLNDGMVAFMHWEYQERNFYNQHTVWRCRPDGSNMDAYYKQHINQPMSIRDVRQVPESSLCIGTAQGHHSGHQGPLVLFDPAQGINNEEAMWNLTPGAQGIEGGLGPLKKQHVAEGGLENRGGTYINPFPMSDKAFLVSHEMTGDVSDYAIYYVDVWGNRELVHREPTISSFQPFPLRQRKRPPVVVDTVDLSKKHATVFVSDVYLDLPGVEKGAVKYLRINQRLFLPAPLWDESEDENGVNHLHWFPGGSTGRHFSYWTWAPTRTVGLVDVQEDGSAYFKVPAATPIFLQALDEDFCEVRRMRSSFTLQRGEFRSCRGCHESRLDAVANPVNGYPVETMRHSPQQPVPPAWGDRTVLNYDQHIQPILDRHCTTCHGAEQPKAGLDFSGRKIGGFAQSYRTMHGLKPEDPTPIKKKDQQFFYSLHPEAAKDSCADKAPAFGKLDADDVIKAMQLGEWPNMLVSISDRQSNADITMPYQFGSTKSKLIRTLLDHPKHQQIRKQMRDEAWQMLVTWVDHNAIYHNTVIDKSRYSRKGEGPLFRAEYILPSPWDPTDMLPSFMNPARVEEMPENLVQRLERLPAEPDR